METKSKNFNVRIGGEGGEDGSRARTGGGGNDPAYGGDNSGGGKNTKDREEIGERVVSKRGARRSELAADSRYLISVSDGELTALEAIRSIDSAIERLVENNFFVEYFKTQLGMLISGGTRAIWDTIAVFVVLISGISLGCQHLGLEAVCIALVLFLVNLTIYKDISYRNHILVSIILTFGYMLGEHPEWFLALIYKLILYFK